MSFLLRTSRNAQGASRGQQPYRVVPSKSKAGAAARPTSRGGQMQQQLVHRRPAASQQQRATQSTKQKSQKASQETQNELQDVISMEEVMEDLRVLEQQQRESQRKLAADKLTKQHKLEQRSSIESKLSSLKYANGEQRAQLVRARDVLSRSTRELGSAKLCSEKSADSLKGFDRRLKKAHMSLRILNALCRKVDTEIILFRNKKNIVLRLKTRVLDSSTASRNRHNDAKHREQSMRKALQEERVKTKNLIEQTTNVRSDVNGLGQDLAAAQAMASSTKLRAEGIASEVIAEDNRHDVAMKDIRATAESIKKQVGDKTARAEAVQKEIEVKKAQLLEAWKRCVQYQQEEGHELSPEPKNDGDTFSLDVNKVKATLEQERAALLLEEAERDRVNEWMSASRDEISGLESKDSAAKEEAVAIRKEAEATQKTESDRHKAHEKCCDELEEVRRSVEGLRRSVSEYEETIGSERKRCGDKQLEQSEAIQNRQTELEQCRAELADAVTAIQDLEGDFAEERECDGRLVEEAKQDADSARSEFEEVRKQSEKLETASDTEIQKEVEDILQAQSILAEDTKEEIEQLCEDFPSLEDIVFEYDPRKTVDEHAEVTLSDLRSDCEARVEKARVRKKAQRKRLAVQKEKEAAEHKAKVRAQRKEAEAARKKEERRNERKLKEAKKREVDGGKRKRRSTEGGVNASVQDGADDRFTAAEEEPLAASQKRIRFEDEEEVGSLVTNLSHGRPNETKRTYGKRHSQAHGRHEASTTVKTKSTADGKVRKSSLKESGHSRSASAGDKIAKAREGTKSSSKNVGGNAAKGDRRMSVQDSHPSKDRSSRSSVDGRTTKRARDADSVASGRTAGSKKKSRLSSTSSLVDAHGKKSSSRSSTQSSSRGERDSKHEDSRSLTSQSKKSRTTKDSSSRDTRDSKKHVSSRTSTMSSSSRREGRETKKDDGRSVSSHKSNSHTSSRPSTKPSGRKALESTRDANDNCAASSRKSSKTTSTHKSSRSVCSQKSSRSVSSHKSSSKRKARESDSASQASGISTMERASKSRRRKKKDGPSTGKAKTTTFSSMGGVQDVDFHF